MYSANLNSYKRIEMESASQGKLLLRLYDGAIDFIEMAVDYSEKNDQLEYRRYVGKVQAIVTELMSTLNMEAGDIAKNLLLLYEFMLRQLLDAYKQSNVDNLHSVSNLLKGLRDAWEVIVNGVVSKEQDAEVEDYQPEPAVANAKRTPIAAYAGAGGMKKSIDFSG